MRGVSAKLLSAFSTSIFFSSLLKRSEPVHIFKVPTFERRKYSPYFQATFFLAFFFVATFFLTTFFLATFFLVLAVAFTEVTFLG